MKHLTVTVASVVLVLTLIVGLSEIRSNITGSVIFKNEKLNADNVLDYEIKSFLGVKDFVFLPVTCLNTIKGEFKSFVLGPVDIISEFESEYYKKIVFDKNKIKGVLEIFSEESPLFGKKKNVFIILSAETKMLNSVFSRKVFLLLEVENSYAYVKNARLIMPSSILTYSNLNGENSCQGFVY